jgi:hypothetical protein
MGFDFLTNKALLKLKSFVSIYNLIIEVMAEFGRRYPDAEAGVDEMLTFLCDEFKPIDINILQQIKIIYSGCLHLDSTMICVGVALCGASAVAIEEKPKQNAMSFKKPLSVFFEYDDSKQSMEVIEGTITESHELLVILIEYSMNLINKKDSLSIDLGAMLLALAVTFQNAIMQESEELVNSNYKKFFVALECHAFKNLGDALKAVVTEIVENTTKSLIAYLQDDFRNLVDIASPSKCVVS